MMLLLLALAAAPPSAHDPEASFALDERSTRRVLAHRLPAGPPPDPTNRVADLERAAELGRELFFDPRLSANEALSCASCHEPERAFSDGRALAEGLGRTTRNAPGLEYAAWQRWLFWDGRADSLWAQVRQPLESELEMGGDRVALWRLLSADPFYAERYAELFGPLPEPPAVERAKPMAEAPDDPRARAWLALEEHERLGADLVLANASKALAAYQRRLSWGSSRFDRFAAALAAAEERRAAGREPSAEAARELAVLSPAELRGLALFEGRAGCWQCHSGPVFSDGEFHDIGLPVEGGGPPRDPGRHEGLRALLADPFNAAGRHTDDPRGERARELEALVVDGESFGQFRTPSLRNVARTAPYGHAGRLATLEEVVRFYSTLEGASFASHHGERVLRPLELEEQEIDDLVRFLGTLDDERRDPRWLRPARAASR